MQFSDWIRLFAWTDKSTKLTNSIARAFGDQLRVSDEKGALLHDEGVFVTAPHLGGTRLVYGPEFSDNEVGAIAHTVESALALVARTAPLAHSIVSQAAVAMHLRRIEGSASSLSPSPRVARLLFDNPQYWVGDVERVANELLAVALPLVMKLCVRAKEVHPDESDRVFARCVSFGLAQFWSRVHQIEPARCSHAHLHAAEQALLTDDLLERMSSRKNEFGRGVWRSLQTINSLMRLRPPAGARSPEPFESRQSSSYPHIMAGGESRHVKVARSTLSALALEREGEVLASLADVAHVQKVVGRGDRWLATNSHEAFDFDRINPVEIVLVFAQLARALANIHDRGVIHRDIRPDHIMRDENGPSFVQFAAACRLQSPLAVVHAGSLPWAPFDQVLVGALKPQTSWDTFALQTSLFFALTGQPPTLRGDLLNERGKELLALVQEASQSGSLAARERLHLARETVRYDDVVGVGDEAPFLADDLALVPGSLTKGLTPILERGLHVRQAQRFHTALELAEALEGICLPSKRAAGARNQF